MSNSIPDVQLNDDWLNLYASTGISVGTELQIQNKTSNMVHIAISSTKPTSRTLGYAVPPLMGANVPAGESGAWAIGNGPLLVQR